MKRTYIFSSLLLCLTLCLPLACKTEKKSETSKNPVKVKVLKAEKQSLESTKTYVGRVESATNLSINSPFSARVERVFVKSGQKVRKGDKLAELYSENVESMLSTAQATMRQAQDGYDRLSQVKDNGSVSELKIVEVQTQLSKAQAMLNSATKAKEDCIVKAPLDGSIAELRIQAGEELSPMQPLFQILDLEELEVSIEVPEKEIGLYEIGAEAQVTVPALGEAMIKGVLKEKGVNASTLTHSYKCRLALKNCPEELRPGMIGKVAFKEALPQAIVLPASLIRLDERGRYLWVADSQNRARKVYVKTGDYSGNGIIIEEGLEEGQRVICEGMSKVSGGMLLSIE